MEHKAGREAFDSPLHVKARGACLAALGLVEAVALLQFDVARARVDGLPTAADGSIEFVTGSPLRAAIYFCLFCLATLALAGWRKRREVHASWALAAQAHSWRGWLALNTAIFAGLILSSIALTSVGGTSLLGYATWCAGALPMVMALAMAGAPASFWRQLLTTCRTEILLALAAASSILAFALLSRESWQILSLGTLELSQWLLQLYETGVHADPAQQVLGVGDFSVIIGPACSGYEGIGLVLGFLGLYVATFRRQFRFPQVLLVFPIGALAIWLTNSVRIAALVSLGAHWSPDIAVNGFHSHAGWVMFLVVTIGLMLLTHRAAYFRLPASSATIPYPAAKRDPALRLASACLFPFAALMAGRMAADAAGGNHWLYAIEVVAGGAVVWLYRDVYARLISKVSPVSILAGAAVGVIWIATDPGRSQPSELGAWVGALPTVAAIGWLVLRLVGSIVLAPIAEELAFRGYLHRALISRRFETVSPGRFTWLAFAVTSILFGLMHTRWLSAILAGMVYAIVMYRSRRLADPVAAHVASNAVIAAWAIAAQQYSLL